MRINKAKELLERTNWGMDIIAEKTGFSSSSYSYYRFCDGTDRLTSSQASVPLVA